MKLKAYIVLSVAILTAGIPACRAAEQVRERIVYASFRPAAMDLYLFDSPGRAPQRLTTTHSLSYNPVFSPDGRWIVFCSEQRGNPDLYAMDIRNTGLPRLLTDSEAMEDAPAFSPDGKLLAFVSTRDGNADIFVMPFQPESPDAPADAKNLTRHKGGDFNPAFSPDGKQIAFSSDRDGYRESEIYVMEADGSNVRRLTHSIGWDGSPAWSLDRQWIYFYSQRDAAPGIYSMKADGSDQKRIVPGPALSPAVTPEGRVAFAAQQNGRWRIFSTAADGSGKLRIRTWRMRDSRRHGGHSTRPISTIRWES